MLPAVRERGAKDRQREPEIKRARSESERNPNMACQIQSLLPAVCLPHGTSFVQEAVRSHRACAVAAGRGPAPWQPGSGMGPLARRLSCRSELLALHGLYMIWLDWVIFGVYGPCQEGQTKRARSLCEPLLWRL